MTVGKDGHVAVRRPDLRDHPVRPAPDVLDRLAAGHPVVPERPPGSLGQDLGRRPTLVLAVVPLGQVRTDLRDVAEAGEPAGLEGALQGTDQHVGELPALEEEGQRRRLLAAPLRQWHVRPARVTPWTAHSVSP